MGPVQFDETGKRSVGSLRATRAEGYCFRFLGAVSVEKSDTNPRIKDEYGSARFFYFGRDQDQLLGDDSVPA